MSVASEKILLRTLFLHKIKNLSLARKKRGSKDCIAALSSILPSEGAILSFSPMGSEIDIEPFNALLQKEGRLCLFKVIGDDLAPYRVLQDTVLKRGPYSFLEPEGSPLLPLTEIRACIIPAVAYDKTCQRLGRGFGHYDRFLAKLLALPTPPLMIGVGYKEQGYRGVLPYEDHDIKVTKVILC
jgi:5-formyltetrahydrofolate cyclo-ligase